MADHPEDRRDEELAQSLIRQSAAWLAREPALAARLEVFLAKLPGLSGDQREGIRAAMLGRS
jgi:hypothetical protein